MSVAGSFYPKSCSEINQFIDTCNTSVEEHSRKKVKAVISPHAGYIYSGFSANSAFNRMDTSKIKRVILIGPSHRVHIKGASVCLHDSYASPCGDLPIDLEYSKYLIEKYEGLSFLPLAHHEHSTETQVPFIRYYCKDVELVEIVYGDIEHAELIPLIKKAFKNEENLVVVSTDLSHFHSLEEAKKYDNICLKAVKDMNPLELESGCEACGITGLKAVLSAAKQLDMQSEVVDYRTSYDASSDANRVVGYMSALIF